jgi:hypothetical protein
MSGFAVTQRRDVASTGHGVRFVGAPQAPLLDRAERAVLENICAGS